MARRVNFGGASIVVPGAYSTQSTNLVGATPALPTGRVGILGEAAKGAPGDSSSDGGVKSYSSQELQSLIDYFGSGSIVDAARALFNPSNDARIAQGANRVYVWKTNSSTRANLSLATGWGSLSDRNYGSEGNLVYSILDLDSELFDIVSSDNIVDPTFSAGADLDSKSLTVRLNGGALATFTFSAVAANHDTLAKVFADLNGSVTGSWAPGNPGLIWSAIDANHLGVTAPAGSNEHRAGRGRSFQIIGGNARSFLELDSAALNDMLISASSEPDMRVRMARQLDNLSEDSDNNIGDIGGKIYFEIGCDDTTCTLSISSTALSTNAAARADLNLSFANYPTLNDMATYISSQTGYVCRVPASINGGLPPSVLDRVSAIGIAYSGAAKYPGRVKADSYEFSRWFELYSSLSSASRTSYIGLPDALPQTYLAGGARGASQSSDFTAGFSAMEAEELDVVIPLVSQDATDDIAEDAAYTDAGSSYDADAILLAAKNHCKNMSSVINRKERCCYLGYRGTWSEVKDKAKAINSEFASLVGQDMQLLATSGDLAWFQPHISACIAAGMQAGGEVGQPTTFKYVNCNGIRFKKKQGVEPSSSEKFDPRTQAADAIENGVLCFDAPSSGGIRLLRQISTYTKDDNFALIAPSVLYAAHFTAKTLRLGLEQIFVGEKARTGTAKNIESYVIAIMADMLRQDIIVGDDTNGGIGWKNLTVSVSGNTAYVDITITPVQGVDFILNRIILDNIRQSA